MFLSNLYCLYFRNKMSIRDMKYSMLPLVSYWTPPCCKCTNNGTLLGFAIGYLLIFLACMDDILCIYCFYKKKFPFSQRVLFFICYCWIILCCFKYFIVYFFFCDLYLFFFVVSKEELFNNFYVLICMKINLLPLESFVSVLY